MTLRRLVPALVAAFACSSGLDSEPLRSPLRITRSASDLAADLDVFVPAALARTGVPGASVAVVRDGEVLFTGGYGVADVLTQTPVTPQTVFEVASNSKPVAAYAALLLVDAGVLSLDAPLVGTVDRSLLPPSDGGERTTLRQLLSHSAGLSNLGVGVVTDRRQWLPPGERFSYSGHGYELLGRVLETVTGEPLARHLERRVLEPLGLRSSGYGMQEPLARPHMPAWTVALAALIPLLLAAAPVFGIGWLAHRLVRTGFHVRTGVAVSLALGAAATARLLGPATAGVAFLLLGGLAALAWTAFRAGRRLAHPASSRRAPVGVHAGVVLACLALLLFALTRPAIPLPRRQIDFVAAGGLLATAPDLARFLAELMAPTGLSPTSARQMTSPQVGIDASLSWGLGIGIQHGREGNALWHWGQNPGFESLMVGFPSERLGVVVLTNGGPTLAGLALAREVAHRAIGGEHGRYWMAVPGTLLPGR